MFLNIVLFTLFYSLFATGFGSGKDRILLNDLQVLTLRHGQSTTARRSSPIPQLKCVGGSAGCSFTPQVVQCYNRGSDGYDVQVGTRLLIINFPGQIMLQLCSNCIRLECRGHFKILLHNRYTVDSQ